MLKGEAKKKYQREYMRQYMRERRGLNRKVLTSGPGVLTKQVGLNTGLNKSNNPEDYVLIGGKYYRKQR